MIGADLARAERLIGERAGRLGRPISVVAQTESTNDDAKRGARAGAPHGSVWVAEAQSRGRGRHGRTWIASPTESLLFSVLLRLKCAPANLPRIALACGLAVRDAVARAIDDDAAVLLKWPNDVLVQGPLDGRLRKVSGVLVESSLSGDAVEHVVCGVGVNVSTKEFPEALADVATSVILERESRAKDGVVDRAALLADILEGLDADVEGVAREGLERVHGRLSRYDALRGRTVELDGVRGVAQGIDVEGRLLVERSDGTLVRVSSGEVCLRAERQP
jgi:BirA family transcriptional regulator, biotin operon repressor / biotin---[acetyl-CoA-carboxylase] ligase